MLRVTKQERPDGDGLGMCRSETVNILVEDAKDESARQEAKIKTEEEIHGWAERRVAHS